jgi:hypothetical protein
VIASQVRSSKLFDCKCFDDLASTVRDESC